MAVDWPVYASKGQAGVRQSVEGFFGCCLTLLVVLRCNASLLGPPQCLPLQNDKNCCKSPQVLRKSCSLKPIISVLAGKIKRGDTDQQQLKSLACNIDSGNIRNRQAKTWRSCFVSWRTLYARAQRKTSLFGQLRKSFVYFQNTIHNRLHRGRQIDREHSLLESTGIEEARIRKQSSFPFMGRSQVEKTNFFSYNINLMRVQLTIFFSLLLTASAVNWQAADNITESNRTFIWDTINNNIATYAPSNLAPFSTFISIALNNQWDPAWNVFVIELIDPSLDAILYGYAFRKHWMWFNGYGYGGKTYSFVIWKDYNCHTWHTVSNSDWKKEYPSTDPSYPMYLIIVSAYSQMARPNYEEIWQLSSNLVEKMNEQNPANAFSLIAAQNGLNDESDSTNMNGRFCSAGAQESYLFIILPNILTNSGEYNGVHKFLALKTR